MNIIKPSYKIESVLIYNEILSNLERAGRTAYKSEDRITTDSAETFIKMLISRGHESVLEHEYLRVRFICDRGVTHELVRHRIMAFTQESTRYCNYGKGKGIAVIKPCFWNEGDKCYDYWLSQVHAAEYAYNAMIESGATPQEARSILPNSVKTEIVCTTNIREWRHIFKLRTSPAAHPQMRELMIPLLKELQCKLPVLFNDIEIKGAENE